MGQDENNAKEQALFAFVKKVGSFVTMMPEDHRCEAAALIGFTATMSGAMGDPFRARGIASEIADLVNESVQEHHEECGNAEGDDNV